MAQHLTFVLDGNDNLSPVLNGAGDASTRLHRRLNDDMAGNAAAVRRFTTDANGRLRDLNGRFVSAADAARLMGDGMPVLVRRLGDVSSAGGDAAVSLGKSGGGLGGAMIGVAAIAGLSLLPALGALVPMMAGAGLAAGTLKLGFSGIGEAMEAAGKGKKEYAEALKKLPKPARDFTKELVGLKKEFGGIGKDIQKAMLPGFTKALKDAGPLVKILGDGMTQLGGAFGKAAQGAGKLFQDSGFQQDLKANLDLGRMFVGDMLSGFGRLGRSFLDFGAASKPTLTALSGGIRDLLGQGLPGMFDGLKVGIEGSSKFLTGFFNMINTLLPAIGRFSGEVARTFGPLLGELMTGFGERGAGALDFFGKALHALMPVFKDLGYGVKSLTDILRLIGPTVADVGSAIVGTLIPNFGKVEEAKGPLQRLNDAINENKIGILEMARVAGNAFLDIAGFAIQMAPYVVGGFRVMATGALTIIDGLVSGAATAFGNLPVIGDKFKDANTEFDKFKEGFLGGLETAQHKVEDFAAAAGPRLSAGKLKLDINSWNAQLTEAKRKLNTVPKSKQASVIATIKDLEAKIASARRQLGDIDGTVATTYVNTVYQKAEASVQKPFRRDGGPAPRFAGGGMPSGMLSGPGTGTSDSIPMWWASDGEYVINARSTAKYLGLIEAINADTLGSGRGMAGAGSAAAAGLAGGMTAGRDGVLSSARLMAAAVTAGVKAELEIASPSKKMTALAKDIGKGLILGLTGSRDKIQATAKDLAADIRAAFSGAKEAGLLRAVDAQTKKLLGLAAARDKLAATITAARQFASTVTQSARDGAGLSNLGLEPEQVTAGSIKSGLASKLAQIKQFTSYIGILAKKGLNRDLLRQILNMGPEAGFAYASALVGADKATFGAINSLQSQIKSSSDSLGRAGADALYDSGAAAGKGFLKGLESQQKAIQDAMIKIAKGMEAAIKKALGIKSPSTVMAQLGVYSTQGLAAGLVEGVPVLDRALGAVAGRVADTRPVLGRAAAAGGGGTVVNVQVDVHEAMDPVAVGRELQRVLLQFGRAQGATVSLNVGG
ncbi:hypothetical protein [Streptomyces sp. A012304]|uniref:hypothetical protein n=1 Tax=Streptomyces sp. A012304 TaxID=375446 RepID=UPI002230937D|nr:hypothetical protein [Streptomyces sp. A012304]GKQ34597.1 hypothetical protein ALMP_11460 [Streptomyces sp. A012304]